MNHFDFMKFLCLFLKKSCHIEKKHVSAKEKLLPPAYSTYTKCSKDKREFIFWFFIQTTKLQCLSCTLIISASNHPIL